MFPTFVHNSLGQFTQVRHVITSLILVKFGTRVLSLKVQFEKQNTFKKFQLVVYAGAHVGLHTATFASQLTRFA